MPNYIYQAKNLEDLRRVADDYAFIGRYHTVDENELTVTVHALPLRKEKKRKDDRNRKPDRESAEDSGPTDGSTGNERPARRSNGYTRGKFVEGTD